MAVPLNANQLKGIELLARGATPGEVGRQLGVSCVAVQKWQKRKIFADAVLNRKVEIASGKAQVLPASQIQPSQSRPQPQSSSQPPPIAALNVQIDMSSIQKIEDLQRYGVLGYAMILQEGFTTGRLNPTFKAVVDKVLTRTGDLKPNPPKEAPKKIVFRIGHGDEIRPHLKLADKPVLIDHLADLQKFKEEFGDIDVSAG